MKKKDALTEYCGGSYDWFYTINNTKREIKKTETYGTSCLLISDEQIAALKEDFAFMSEHTIERLCSELKVASSLSEKDTAILNFLNELWNQLGKTPLNTLYYKPYETIKNTNLKNLQNHDIVNIEYDLFAKYIQKFATQKNEKSSKITFEFLKENGF